MALLVTAILQRWFGALQGDYWLNSAAVALTLFGIAGTIVGLVSLLGRPGLPLGALLFLLFANPLSAASQPIEFLVEPWGAIGQWFPPGAAVTLLRDLSYFPRADATLPWLMLGGWAVLGPRALARRALSQRRARQRCERSPRPNSTTGGIPAPPGRLQPS